ncbi:MAG: FtsX-like permease family protein [Clostridia bacterium]|nr:FtsX-like permease family protein [Clostridia bacterium]
MIELAIKNIWGRKTRSVLTIMGVIVAMQLYIILSTIMGSYEKDVQKQISNMAGRVIVQLKTESGASFLPGSNVIKESDAKEVMGLQGVDNERSTPVLIQAIVPSKVPNAPPTVMAAGIEKGKEEAYFGNVEVDGESKISKSSDVILGAGAKEFYKAKLGDSITVRDDKFTVVGILPEINSQIDASVVMNLATAQEIFVRPSLVSSVMLTATQVDKVVELAKKVTELNPKLTASTSESMKKSADEMLEGQRRFFAMINNTVVAVAAFIVMIVMVMAVFERRKEIGTLKAIGASRAKILGIIVTESLTLSLIGGVMALPISVLLIRLVFGGWLFDTSQWGQTIAVAVGLGIFAGLWPAWSAQRVNPLESLRYE